MREKFQRFMIGRYGNDDLGKFTLGLTIALYIINIFFRIRLISTLMFLTAVIGIYRMFSKNIQKRYQENIKFLNLKNKFMAKWNRGKSDFEQRKTHHIYRCPTCRQKIRIPRGKGRICITCPKCKTEFTKTS